MNKVCFVMPYHILENRGGGAEVQAWLLAKELARRGYLVYYICESVYNKAGQKECCDGVTIHWIRHYRYFAWLNSYRYYGALSSIQPDWVIQRMSSYVTGIIGFFVKKHQKRFAWICTDDSLPFRSVFVEKQIQDNLGKKRNLVKNALLLTNAFIYDRLRHFGMKHVTIAFAQNAYQKQQLKMNFGVTAKYLRSGHKLPCHSMTAKNRFELQKIIWVTHMGKHKQPRLFIELAKKYRHTGWEFIMVGGHTGRDYLKNLTMDKPDNLRCSGKLPFEEALTQFDNATVFINTSTKDGEGFPNTFIQAWLRGLPVLSLNVNPDNVITEYQLGYFADGSFNRLCDQLRQLMTDEKQYIELSKHISSLARKRYSIENVANQFLQDLGFINGTYARPQDERFITRNS